MKNKTEQKQKAKMLENVLIDAHVEADLGGLIWFHNRDPVRYARDLERAIKDFHDFLRDHRSQDMVRLSVVEERKNLCSVCKREWETFEAKGKVICANCGAEVETQ